MKLRYFTVQDAVWAHFQLNKSVQAFDYARLEQAVNAQYRLGENDQENLAVRASGVFNEFMETQPFESGNQDVAFVLMAAFLLINGHSLDCADKSGCDALTGNGGRIRHSELEIHLHKAQSHSSPTMQDAVKKIVCKFTPALAIS